MRGFKKAPIGAGPYKFMSFTPGMELVLEAHEGYWKKPASVKHLVRDAAELTRQVTPARGCHRSVRHVHRARAWFPDRRGLAAGLTIAILIFPEHFLDFLGVVRFR
jgi:hypothetical protein